MSAGRHKLTYEDFVARARARHGDRYEYPADGQYLGARTKMTIICREHGEFRQDASNHTAGNGCPKCALIASGEATRRARKDRPATFARLPKEPFGALGGLYKLPFWS